MQTEITNHYGNLNIHGTGTGGFQNPAAQNLDRETRTGETVILGEAVKWVGT
ncbi:MAG: hypothetical protein HYU64_18965 [Armatimonadetes bacterium]|nr:hypothetical protein [Armatimonadota bacterium]